MKYLLHNINIVVCWIYLQFSITIISNTQPQHDNDDVSVSSMQRVRSCDRLVKNAHYPMLAFLNMLFSDTNYAKWCKNWLVRKNPPKVTFYNENGLLVCRANNTVPCSPSQGNSCTVNDWDTLFYPAHVVACELPGPHSCWLLCLECATRTCLLLHQGWQCGRLKTAHRGWMDSSWSQHHRVGQCF